jgi:alpha-tubulin suppressor-like RCC1 family protein
VVSVEFELQVKIEDPSEKIFLLSSDEFAVDLACGALFTIALTNKGRIFGCGILGATGINTLEDQIEKTRFKEIVFEDKIERISAGLSGAAAITSEGAAYFWGKFGKAIINVPKKV